MYNGIGLRTVRGSGTNGYVQRNLSYVNNSRTRQKMARNQRLDSSGDFKAQGGDRPAPNTDILLHEQKRKVELQLLELSLEMEDRGCSPEEIQLKITRERKRLLAQRSVDIDQERANYEDAESSHARKKRKEDENTRIKDAFGITSDYVEGESFDLEVQERRRQERKKRKEQEWKERVKAQQQRPKEKCDKIMARHKRLRSNSRSRLTSFTRRSISPSEYHRDDTESRKSYSRPHVMEQRSHVSSHLAERKLQKISSSRSDSSRISNYGRSRSPSRSRGRKLPKGNRRGKNHRATNKAMRSHSRSRSISSPDSRSSYHTESDRRSSF